MLLKLESQLSVHRQRYSQLDKEKQNLQQLLQEEINHRNNVDSKFRQAEVNQKSIHRSLHNHSFQHDIETLNVSRSQLQQHIIEVENERMVEESPLSLSSFLIDLFHLGSFTKDQRTRIRT